MYKAVNLPYEKHIFLGAKGGVSEGVYSSLNVSLASDDSPEAVNQNLQIAAGYLGLEARHLHLLQQGVSSHVEYVSEPTRQLMTADGVVTDKPEIVLTIRTADCAPILLADYTQGVIGAAHAGWRGAWGGVIENVIELMIDKGAKRENITAAIGPCIGQKSYEVDQNFYNQFVEKNQNWKKYFMGSVNPRHYLFDLERFCADRLMVCGVGNITVSGLDTYLLENDYFSFRRNTHRQLIHGLKCFPVELSGIVL